MRDLGNELVALLVERGLDGLSLANWIRSMVADVVINILLLTDFRLGILKFRFKQAKLLELDLELLGSLLMLRVIVRHLVGAVSNCSL